MAANVWRGPPVPPPYGHSTQTTFTLPMTEPDMLLGNPQCRVAAARDGVYLPLRMTGPSATFATAPSVQLMQDVTMVGNIVIGGSENNYRGAHWTVAATLGGTNQMTAYTIDDLPQVATPQGPRAALVDDGFDGYLCSVTIWRGLAPSATLTVKSIVGLEVAVGPDSPIRAFVKPPLPPIPAALDAYFGIVAMAPQVYPASYNVFGAILPLLASVAKMAAPFLLPLVGQGVQKLGGWIAGKAVAGGAAKAAAEPRAVTRSVARAPSLRRLPGPSARSRASSLASRSSRSGRTPSVRIVASRRKKR